MAVLGSMSLSLLYTGARTCRISELRVLTTSLPFPLPPTLVSLSSDQASTLTHFTTLWHSFMLHKKQEGETKTAPSSVTSNGCRTSHHIQFEETEMQFLYLQHSTLKIHKTTS